MARNKSIVEKAVSRPRPATGRSQNRKPASVGAFERIVSIPEIAVYSELPFARVATIGGDATVQRDEQKTAATPKPARTSRLSSGAKRSPAKAVAGKRAKSKKTSR